MSTNDEQFTGYRTNHPDDIAHFASVRSFQDFLVDKTNPVVMVTLTIDGKGFLDNATFETHLTQHTNAHDEFTIIVNDTAIDDFKGQVMKNSKDLLGENITIHFHQFDEILHFHIYPEYQLIFLSNPKYFFFELVLDVLLKQGQLILFSLL